MEVPYLNRYRHAEYLQYMKDVLDLLEDQDVTALALSTQQSTLQTLVNAIDGAFNQSQGSTLTQEIIALDERRDRAIIGLRTVLEGYNSHYDAAIATAAVALFSNINAHGSSIYRLSYQEETAVLNSIITDWETETELSEAVSSLGLTGWLNELKSANTLFAAKYLERVEETAANPAASIIALRSDTTIAYRDLIAHITAHQTLESDAAYNVLSNQISVLASQYNQVVDNRSGEGNDAPTSPLDPQ